jgi:hypothetical protein
MAGLGGRVMSSGQWLLLIIRLSNAFLSKYHFLLQERLAALNKEMEFKPHKPDRFDNAA